MKKPRRQPRVKAATHSNEAGVTAVLTLRAKLEVEGYEVSIQLLAPGTIFGEHCPCDTRLEAVFSGRLRVVIGRREHQLGPGDWLEVPRGATLLTEVLGEDPVLYLLAVRNCPAD
jgi:mannose-6-phosphate isomerase-like protein (cupin superfamily)